MSGNSLVADTNIVLYLLSGDETVANLLNDWQVYLSFISELELLSYKYLTDKENKRVQEFLSVCHIIDINDRIKENSIYIKRKYGLKLPDSIIAGTAMFLDFPLITADSDFVKIKELEQLLYEK